MRCAIFYSSYSLQLCHYDDVSVIFAGSSAIQSVKKDLIVLYQWCSNARGPFAVAKNFSTSSIQLRPATRSFAEIANERSQRDQTCQVNRPKKSVVDFFLVVID